MTESGDAGVAAAVVAFAGMRGPIDEFNAVPAWVLESNEASDVPRRGLALGAAPDSMPKPLQLGCRRIAVILAADLKSDRLIGGVFLEIAERMLAGIGLETTLPIAMLGNFPAEIVDRKPRGPLDITRSEPDITHIQQADHASLLPR
jgi:hypothetical protein